MVIDMTWQAGTGVRQYGSDAADVALQFKVRILVAQDVELFSDRCNAGPVAASDPVTAA